MLFHEQIGFDISYSRLRYILMGGSVLAALLIISIGEWGGDEALHCAAERNFILLSGKMCLGVWGAKNKNQSILSRVNLCSEWGV